MVVIVKPDNLSCGKVATYVKEVFATLFMLFNTNCVPKCILWVCLSVFTFQNANTIKRTDVTLYYC